MNAETAPRDVIFSRAVIFHCLADATAAVAAAKGRPLVLLSAPGAAGYAGPDYLKAIADQAQARSPQTEAVIDCGDDAGAAMAALRGGWRRLIFSGRADVLVKLVSIAAQTGASVEAAAPPALDLQDQDDPARACADWIAAASEVSPDRAAPAPRG